MPSPKYAITPASAAIALRYDKTVSKGIQTMERVIDRLVHQCGAKQSNECASECDDDMKENQRYD